MYVKVLVFLTIAVLACITPSQGRPGVLCPPGVCSKYCQSSPDCPVFPFMGDTESIPNVKRNMDETTEPSNEMPYSDTFSLDYPAQRSAAAAAAASRSAAAAAASHSAAAAAASRSASADNGADKYCPDCTVHGEHFVEDTDSTVIMAKRNVDDTTEPSDILTVPPGFKWPPLPRSAAAAAASRSDNGADKYCQDCVPAVVYYREGEGTTEKASSGSWGDVKNDGTSVIIVGRRNL